MFLERVIIRAPITPRDLLISYGIEPVSFGAKTLPYLVNNPLMANLGPTIEVVSDVFQQRRMAMPIPAGTEVFVPVDFAISVEQFNAVNATALPLRPFQSPMA